MNGRVAKKLRRVAEDGTVGSPAVLYERQPRGLTTRLLHGCTRRLYKNLKSVQKTGEVPDRAFRDGIVRTQKTRAHQQTLMSLLASVIGRRPARKETFRV